jgi:hypothetical protein
MKARAAAARIRKKQAGTGSTRAAVRRLANGPQSKHLRENLRQEANPEVVGKKMSKKKAARVRSRFRGTQSQTHHAQQ